MAKPTKHYSSLQENMIADYLGWEVVSGSGARDCHPGDIRSDQWLGECKTHTERGQKISFMYDFWNKICDEAVSKFKVPVLFVDDGSQSADHTWVLYPYTRFEYPGLKVISDHGIKHRKNIIFDHLDIFKYLLSEQRKNDLRPVVLHFDFNGRPVGVTSLTAFRVMFGEN